MSESPQLPGIGKPTKTYLDAWKQFETEIFDIEELHKQLLRESTEPERIPSQDTLNSRLARAAVAGIVGSYGDRRYNIRLNPKAEREKWNEVAIDHIGRVKEEIEEAYEERAATSEDERKQSEQFITHDGESIYARLWDGIPTLRKIWKGISKQLSTQTNIQASF